MRSWKQRSAWGCDLARTWLRRHTGSTRRVRHRISRSLVAAAASSFLVRAYALGLALLQLGVANCSVPAPSAPMHCFMSQVALQKNFTRGRKVAFVAAAALYIVCRYESAAHSYCDLLPSEDAGHSFAHWRALYLSCCHSPASPFAGCSRSHPSCVCVPCADAVVCPRVSDRSVSPTCSSTSQTSSAPTCTYCLPNKFLSWHLLVPSALLMSAMLLPHSFVRSALFSSCVVHSLPLLQVRPWGSVPAAAVRPEAAAPPSDAGPGGSFSLHPSLRRQ